MLQDFSEHEKSIASILFQGENGEIWFESLFSLLDKKIYSILGMMIINIMVIVS